MKKATDEPEVGIQADDMRPEYDFRGGVRGKHAQAFRRGHTVKIHREDGTIEVHHFDLVDGAVMLEPEVQEYFPDAKAVNHALRTLIELVPGKRPAGGRKSERKT